MTPAVFTGANGAKATFWEVDGVLHSKAPALARALAHRVFPGAEEGERRRPTAR